MKNFPQEDLTGEDTLHSNRRLSESSMALEQEECQHIPNLIVMYNKKNEKNGI